jgi:4-hydroxymandelate oxidase
MTKRQNVSEQIEAINLCELEMKARELLPQTAYDYYASGANDENTLRENRVDHLNVRTNTDLGTFMFSVPTATSFNS